MRTQISSHQADAAIAKLADEQYGVLARRQLLIAGLSPRQIGERARRGLLVPLHRGVYAAGHRRLTADGIWLAAVLATGPGAVLSHRDAAKLHGLGRWEYGPVEVTTPAYVRSTAKVHVRARRRLDADDVTTVAGIPATTVARTLVDLAKILSRERLLHAMTSAERAGTLDLGAVRAAFGRVRHRPGPGAATLRAALAEFDARGAQVTRSELEIAFRRLVRVRRLPPPELNAWAEGVEVDALWRAERVAVELDSWEFHRDRSAFARDRAKGNHLTLRGWTVLRLTHRDLTRDARRVAADIRRALGHRGG